MVTQLLNTVYGHTIKEINCDQKICTSEETIISFSMDCT